MSLEHGQWLSGGDSEPHPPTWKQVLFAKPEKTEKKKKAAEGGGGATGPAFAGGTAVDPNAIWSNKPTGGTPAAAAATTTPAARGVRHGAPLAEHTPVSSS